MPLTAFIQCWHKILKTKTPNCVGVALCSYIMRWIFGRRKASTISAEKKTTGVNNAKPYRLALAKFLNERSTIVTGDRSFFQELQVSIFYFQLMRKIFFYNTEQDVPMNHRDVGLPED